MNNTIIPKGTTDYYGSNARLRDYILKQIEETYQSYGFEALYTPIIEHADVFKGHHGEGEKLLFNLNDKNGERYVLKYDSTVPLARVVSMYDDIKLPYKRYQLQQSFRDDNIDKGHYREFIQCDGDIVGTDSLTADAEFIDISYNVLQKLGFRDYTIRLNHRQLIKAIAEMNNISDKEGLLSIQRAIDVSDKINKGSIDDIRAELSKTDINEKIANTIVELMDELSKTKNVKGSIDLLGDYFGKDNENAVKAVSDLREIISYANPDALKKSKIDFTLARGADYYTGFILEAVINKLNLGAVLGGGRFDDLVSAFSDKSVPAVGMAFGLERLIVAMKDLELNKRYENCLESVVIVYDTKSNSSAAYKIANMFRGRGGCVSLIFAEDVPVESLRAYCEYRGATTVYVPDGESVKAYSLDKINQIRLDGPSRTRCQ